MAATKPIRIYDLVYHEMYTPAGCLTEAQWLRIGHRVRGEFYTKLLVLHDRPHGRKRPSEEPYPPKEVAALRQRLAEAEYPSDEDRRLLTRMELACQVTWCNLYAPNAVVRIETPTQAEAWDLLSSLWRCGSHKDEFIFGGTRDTGEKWCFTAGGKITHDWDIVRHKQGVEYLGVKRGEFTRIIDLDLDRHSSAVSSRDHLQMVLNTLRWLQRHMPWASPHVSNINPRNGSCHITMYLPYAIPVAQARAVVDDIREECPWLAGVEIYPSNCPQFLLPLRRDKVTVIDRVLTASVKAWRKVEVPRQKQKKGRKPQKVRREYLAMDAAAYWQWINDPDRKPCDLALVETELRKAYRGMPDGKTARKTGKKNKKERPSVAGMAPIGKMRGRLSRELVAFWSGKGERPHDSTVTKYTTMTLRVLILVEGMFRDEAFDWVMERLRPLRNQAGDGPLVYDWDEMARVVGATADAIAAGNGYQADPEASSLIWEKVRDAWNRSGFRLSDEDTWNRARRVVHDEVPDLDWSPRLLDLVPELADALKTADLLLARKTLAAVCWQVETRSELSLSYLARIMQDLGIKGYADKAVAVRRLLEARGIIRLVKRGFRFGEDGVGNFYELAEDVAFVFAQENPSPANPAGKEVSTYPSSGGLDLRPLLARMRRKRCLDRYHERLRGLSGDRRRAA